MSKSNLILIAKNKKLVQHRISKEDSIELISLPLDKFAIINKGSETKFLNSMSYDCNTEELMNTLDIRIIYLKTSSKWRIHEKDFINGWQD